MVEVEVGGVRQESRPVLHGGAHAGRALSLGGHTAGRAAAGLGAVLGDDDAHWREVEELPAL